MAFWSPVQLAALANGEWLHDVPPANGAQICGVGIDTRTLAPGHVYVAVKGENHDGHDFVESALERGAVFAVVEHAERFADSEAGPMLVVKSCVDALQAWATAYRDVLADGGCTVIAVAGSNGKTTTRHLIHHVLTACGKSGTQSPKSFNNHLGVPLTLLAAEPEHDFVACEIGTNHPGEIAALAQIVRPDVAVITNIGAEHLEFFGDLDGVAKEESTLLPHVRPGGVAYVESEAAQRVMPFYDVQENVAFFPVFVSELAGVVPHDFPLPGEHNHGNAVLACSVGSWFGCGDAAMERTLKGVAAPGGRMQMLRFGDITVIHDAYNANPDSMAAALNVLAEAPGRKLAVLGDMLELGAHAQREHRAAGGLAARTAEMVWYVGEFFDGGVPWSDALAAEIAAALNPGDTLLLKGSRGMRLERILPAIEERFGPAKA